MKKTFLSLILVLMSTFNYSQQLTGSDVYASIDGSSYKQIDLFTKNSSLPGNTLVTEYSSSIITLSIDIVNGSNFGVVAGDTYTLSKNTYTSNPMYTILRVKQIGMGGLDTLMFRADSSDNYMDGGYYFLTISNSNIGTKAFCKFRIKNSKPYNIFKCDTLRMINQIGFNIDTLNQLNYNLPSYPKNIKGVYEYKIDNINAMPTSGTSTIAATKTASFVTTDPFTYTTSGIYYLHLRAYGGQLTQWTTYSVNVIYSTVGFNETYSNISNIVIYPNPTQDYLYLDVKDNQINMPINIYNMTGQSLIINKRYIQSNRIEIDMQSYPTGVYYIGLGETIKKFIKQ